MTTHGPHARRTIQIRRFRMADLPDITKRIAEVKRLPQHQCFQCAKDAAGVWPGAPSALQRALSCTVVDPRSTCATGCGRPCRHARVMGIAA